MSHRAQTAWVLSLVIAGLTIAGLHGGVQADHIPGHQDDDPLFPVPLPGQKHFNGGIAFITAIGPAGGSEVFNTTFDITLVSDGETPASDLIIVVGMLVGEESPVYVETEVTGADLGFGAGPGAHHGTFETDALNGIAVESFLLPPYSLIDLAIGGANGNITGHFVNSTITFELVDFPSGDVNGDGVTNMQDLLQVIAAWGPCDGCPEDLDGDGVVGPLDLQFVLDDLTPRSVSNGKAH
jgi:hypothetical protein